jgi:hypothetical protein
VERDQFLAGGFRATVEEFAEFFCGGDGAVGLADGFEDVLEGDCSDVLAVVVPFAVLAHNYSFMGYLPKPIATRQQEGKGCSLKMWWCGRTKPTSTTTTAFPLSKTT